MEFSACLSSSSSLRRSCSGLFKIPSYFQFNCESDGIFFVHGDTLCYSQVDTFHLGFGDGTGSWIKFLNEDKRPLSRAEQLLKERMRTVGSNIKFDHISSSKLIFIHGLQPQLRTYKAELISSFPDCDGAVGYQPCPAMPHFVACVMDGDIFLVDGHTSHTHQLTFTKDLAGVSAGVPPYIIQEEFDRYVGFLWQNTTTNDDFLHILYEEVNEEGVETVHAFNPVSQAVEDHIYPRPGKKNARSQIKLLAIKFAEDKLLEIEERHLPVPLGELFPQCCEYLVRFGWMPCGKAVWIQLMDRLQQNLIIAVIEIQSFQTGNKSSTAIFPKIYILYEEKSSIWMPVSDCLEFLPVESEKLRFVWLSQMRGHRHLYLIEAKPPPCPEDNNITIPSAEYTTHTITQGNWSVLESKVWVDARSNVVYFLANKASPLDKHLYICNLSGDTEPKQLTKDGLYHDVTLDSCNFKYFLSVSSSWSDHVRVSIHSLANPGQTLSEWQGPRLPDFYSPPTPFSVKCESGEELYGAIYSPEVMKKGVKVPTIVYVYGGPGVQFVTSGLSKHLPRIQAWRHHGFAVVMLDNRGSTNRGIQFEAFIKGGMGKVEIDDQVLGIQAAAQCVDFIDVERIGIMGWSYGGFLSLMAIANRPDVFKVCVSGAPVTDWFYYDTAYTERYLGIPPRDNPAYLKSSVLHYASHFPNESGKVLIVHGFCDENVLFTHTASLCERLVTLGKPHTVQFYSNERHGLRSFSALVHCDATILKFFSAL